MPDKYYGLISFLLLLVTCGCGGEIRPKEDPSSAMPGYLSLPRLVPAGQPATTQVEIDSIRVVPAKGRLLTAVSSTVEEATSNIHRAKPPVRTPIPVELPVFTPGENGLPAPRTIPAKGRRLSVNNPALTPALPPDFRDNAQFNIQVLEVEQGLSSSSYLSIQEDRRGHLWFGSANSGLTRYDGRYFAHFTTRLGLSGDRIFSMLQDRHGNLWFGLDDHGGLIRYDGTTFTHFGAESGMTSRVIYDIVEDRQDNLWLGTEGKGVIRYDGTSFTFFTTREGLSADDIFSVVEDRKGHLWFGTEGGGVVRFDGQRFTQYGQVGDSLDVVADIAEDHDGVMWFGTVRNGLYRYDSTGLWQYTTGQGLNHNAVLAIQEDDQSGLWLGTRGGGVSRFDGRNFTHFGVDQGMSSNTVLTLSKDQWGNIWMGTEGGGITKFTPGSFRHITQNEGLKNNSVRTIIQDHNGLLWMGTQRGDISSFDGEQFVHFSLEDVGSSWIISALEDQDGSLWFGTFGGGVIRYQPASGSFTQFSEAEGLSKKNVERMLLDRDGNLWIGTFEGGVNKFDGTSFTHFDQEDGLAGNSVISLLQDSKGNIWLGTYGNGVCRYDGTSFASYTTEQGLSHNVVRVIFEDSSGFLWFGTEGGGLNRFDGEHFVQYQLNEGLGDNHIRSIQEDEQGNLWFATMNGLYQATLAKQDNGIDTLKVPQSSTPVLALVEYGRTDGLKAEDFLANSSLLDDSNRLWWGTEKGIVLLDLKQRMMHTEPPAIYLDQIDLNQQFVDFSDTAALARIGISNSENEPFYGYPAKLDLPHKLNSLTFHFSAMQAAPALKVAFQYRLKDYDQHWSELSTDPYVHYRNLPSGRYEFQLRAIGESGRWSEPLSYAFTVRPPWWLSWWARVLYVLLALASVMVIRRYELKRRRQRQLAEIERARLEEKSKQAEKIAAQARELEKSLKELQEKNAVITAARDQLIVQEKLASLGNLTAGISHEIKNPLNFITNFAEDSSELASEITGLISGVKEQLPAAVYEELLELLEDLKSNAGLIEKNSLKIDRIVRSMMDHARGKDTGWELVDVNHLLDENINLAYHSFRATNLTFNVSIQKDYTDPLPPIKAHTLQIGRVFLNIITNACYAINEKQQQLKREYQPMIRTSTKQVDGATEIRIRDNGPGIPADVLKEIFTPFFTTKPTGQGNTGLGLSISYDIIVKEHHGRLEVESEPGSFTEFLIVLPQNDEHSPAT